MSNTPEVKRSGASRLIGESHFIFMATLLKVAVLAPVVTFGAARPAMTPEPIITLAMSFVFLACRKFLV